MYIEDNKFFEILNNSNKGIMLMSFFHELGHRFSDLNVLLSNLFYLLKKTDDEKITDMKISITETVGKLNEQFNLVRDIGRDNSEGFKDVDLKLILENCLNFLNTRFQRMNINIKRAYQQNIAIKVYCIPSQIRIALFNILWNCIDEIELNRVKSIILVSFEEYENNIIIKISDDGRGIPQHFIEEIPLFILLKNIIEVEHKWKINITSTLKNGTSVEITIPKGEKK